MNALGSEKDELRSFRPGLFLLIRGSKNMEVIPKLFYVLRYIVVIPNGQDSPAHE